eukprot:jgi/Chrpa1/15937/Chrysochromulina_OHIO_Genome00022885-RA
MGVVGETLGAAAIAALPAEQKALYQSMSEAEQAVFAGMSEEQRAAFAAMSPEERAKAMREQGVVGPPLSAAALAALPADQKRLYENMSDAERAAFASMSEEARAAYQSMSAEERATYMKETMGVPEMIGADGKPIKVGGSGSSRRGGGGDAGGLPAAELEKLSPEERAKYETMSAAQRAAFAGMTEEQRKAFASMSEEEKSKMMEKLGFPEFFEGSGGPGTRDISIQADSAAHLKAMMEKRRSGDDEDDGATGAGGMGANGRKRRSRHRGKPMITSLKGSKAVPAWMLHKTARVEYELEMASRGETEEDNQDFGEFVEDRFVELYGLKKIAEANLRDTLKGLKQSSETHTRLEIFRTLTALVPGDAEGESSSQPFSNQAAIFMRQVLGQLVKICREDHLSGMKGDAFWACYAKPDVLKVPAAYFERIIERLNKQVSYLKEQKASAKASAEGEPQAPAANKFAAVQMDPKKEADIIRAIKTLEAVLTDHAKKDLPLTADKMIDESGKSLRGEGEQKVKEINVGDDLSCKKPTAKGTVGRVCVDSFLFRALEHWDKLMDLEEEMLLRAFGTWDFNGDGHLELKEFTHMVKFSNAAVRQAKVTRAFLAASGGADVVHKERLGPIMLSYGLKLENKPASSASPATGEAAG